MNFDFEIDEIQINSVTDTWGPYEFNFSPVLPDPENNKIASATIKSWFGSTPTDTTALLVGASIVPTGENMVDVWFNYPGATYLGRHWLEFTLTLADASKNLFRWGYVIVE